MSRSLGFALVVALASGCPSKPAEPSAPYLAARTMWLDLLRAEHQAAYTHPKVDEILPLLDGIDPSSLDGPFAARLAEEIRQGREAALAQQAREAAARKPPAPALAPDALDALNQMLEHENRPSAPPPAMDLANRIGIRPPPPAPEPPPALDLPARPEPAPPPRLSEQERLDQERERELEAKRRARQEYEAAYQRNLQEEVLRAQSGTVVFRRFKDSEPIVCKEGGASCTNPPECCSRNCSTKTFRCE